MGHRHVEIVLCWNVTLLMTMTHLHTMSMLIYHNVNVHTSRDGPRTRISCTHHRLGASLRSEIPVFARLKKGRHVLCLCEAATGLSSKMCRQAIRMSISTGIGHARKHELLAAKTTIFRRSLHTEHERPHSSIQPIYSRHAPA